MIPDTVETRILQVSVGYDPTWGWTMNMTDVLTYFSPPPLYQLQDAKRELTKAALSGDKIKNMKLGLDDLLALFRGGGRYDDDDD